MSVLKTALGIVTTAYLNDVVAKPRAIGKVARDYCDRVGKPLLLVRGERFVDTLMGDPVQAEVATRRAYPLPHPDKKFGAVVVVNVMECLKRPDRGLHEWRRVADKVFVVLPSWWAPHAWLDPSHRWLIHPDMSRVAPLWTDHRSRYLLPVSDRRYGAPRWRRTTRRRSRPSPNPSSLSPPPSGTPSPSPSESPFDERGTTFDGSDPRPSPMSPESMYEDTPPVLRKDLPNLEEVSSADLSRALGNGPSPSSNSVRALTVVSTPGSGDG